MITDASAEQRRAQRRFNFIIGIVLLICCALLALMAMAILSPEGAYYGLYSIYKLFQP